MISWSPLLLLGSILARCTVYSWETRQPSAEPLSIWRSKCSFRWWEWVCWWCWRCRVLGVRSRGWSTCVGWRWWRCLYFYRVLWSLQALPDSVTLQPITIYTSHPPHNYSPYSSQSGYPPTTPPSESHCLPPTHPHWSTLLSETHKHSQTPNSCPPPCPPANLTPPSDTLSSSPHPPYSRFDTAEILHWASNRKDLQSIIALQAYSWLHPDYRTNRRDDLQPTSWTGIAHFCRFSYCWR